MEKSIHYHESIGNYSFTISKSNKSNNDIKFEVSDRNNFYLIYTRIRSDTFYLMVYKFLPECINFPIDKHFLENKFFKIIYELNDNLISFTINNLGYKTEIKLLFNNKEDFKDFVTFLQKVCLEIWLEEN